MVSSPAPSLTAPASPGPGLPDALVSSPVTSRSTCCGGVHTCPTAVIPAGPMRRTCASIPTLLTGEAEAPRALAGICSSDMSALGTNLVSELQVWSELLSFLWFFPGRPCQRFLVEVSTLIGTFQKRGPLSLQRRGGLSFSPFYFFNYK